MTIAEPPTRPARPAGGVVGTSVPRVDARAKVTGAARYVDDLTAPGALFGRTVRAAIPHGVLRSIRLDPAFDWAGVTVVTASDIPGRNCILQDTDDQPALVPEGGRVRHVAEPVALVAAETRARAAVAADHVLVDIEPRPAVLTVEEALTGAVEVHDGGNVLHELRLERGEVDAAFAAADVVVEGTYRTGPAEHVYLEPQGVLAWWDEGDRLVHVAGSMQCPYFVHRALAALLDLDGRAVDVRQATTGGGFGGKEEYPSVVAAHAALLARKAGRPVKLVYERGEDLAASTKRHPSVIRHRLAATSDGRLLAVDADVILDAGAYVTLSPVVLLRSVLHVAGPYRFPNVRVRGRAVATNHPPSGAFRGFGVPQAIFAAERQVAKMCRALGADPLAFRRANALRPGDTTITGAVLDESAGLFEVLDALEHQLSLAPPSAPSTGPRSAVTAHRGRGFAVAFHGAGFSGNGEAFIQPEATVDLAPDGSFRVLTSLVEMGQGARTVLAQVAADALGVDLALVDVPEPSTLVVPNTGPTVASRTTLIGGAVVAAASRRVRAALGAWAHDHGLSVDDVAAVARARASIAPALSCTEGYTPPADAVWDQATLTGDAYPTYAWSATAVDVAIDDDTSEVRVERCVQVIDAGRAINPQAVAGQVHGGTLQALGWALWERVPRSRGAVVSPSLSTMVVATAADAPEIESVVVEVPYRGGPSGAKGIGELPMDGPAAAAANAVEDALGVVTDELPLLPEVVHRLRGGRP
ncbi:MAG TPA: xanthine dehydrogenase family protein molybdopterin-binding subunit [Acidimicrobiales bacterium]|nr:xanthine dehydrogenase family protein molybdopterin-binding subunit [Acidimicrobiales bacterium]